MNRIKPLSVRLTWLKLLDFAMVETRSRSDQLDLVLHTAVDYLHRRYAGISVVQRAECVNTSAFKNDRIPGRELKYSYSRDDLVTKNIKTAKRAQMLAIIHALGLAYGTVKRLQPNTLPLRKVVLLSESPSAVHTVKHYIHQDPSCLKDIASANDRLLIEGIVARVRNLSRRGLEVAISVYTGADRASKRARTLARQKGRKASKSRRRLRSGNPTLFETEAAAEDHPPPSSLC